MGFLENAVKYGLKKVPLTTAVKNLPWYRVVQVGYKTLKYSYKATRWVDNKTGFTDKRSKAYFDKHGPASPRTIAAGDWAEKTYNKAEGGYDKLKQWGEKKVSKAIKSIADKMIPQPPVVTKTIPNSGAPKHSTPFPKATPKGPSLNLPNIPNMKLRPQGLGKSLPFNTYNNAKKLRAMSPKPKFDPGKSKMFSIKTQATPSKPNPAINKMFSMRTKTNPVKINIARKITPATKPPNPNRFNIAKALSAGRSAAKPSIAKRTAIKPLSASRPIKLAPSRPAPIRRAPIRMGPVRR